MTTSEWEQKRSILLTACNNVTRALSPLKWNLDRSVAAHGRSVVRQNLFTITCHATDNEVHPWRIINRFPDLISSFDLCAAACMHVYARWVYEPEFDPAVDFELVEILDECAKFNHWVIEEVFESRPSTGSLFREGGTPSFSWKRLATKLREDNSELVKGACSQKVREERSDEGTTRFVDRQRANDLPESEAHSQSLASLTRWTGTFNPFEEVAKSLMNATRARMRFHAGKLFDRAVISYDSQDFRRAIPNASVATRVDWSFRDAHILAALAYGRTNSNNTDIATTHCQACLKMNPEDSEARQILARVVRR